MYQQMILSSDDASVLRSRNLASNLRVIFAPVATYMEKYSIATDMKNPVTYKKNYSILYEKMLHSQNFYAMIVYT